MGARNEQQSRIVGGIPPRKSLPQMGASAKRLLLAAQKAAKDEPELLDEVEQTLRQFEIAAAFAESELSIKH